MFKSITIFRILPGVELSAAILDGAVSPSSFSPCGQTKEKSIGWAPPRGEEHGALVESVAGQLILKLMIETKSVPGATVREEADALAAQIERDTGRKPGKKEMKTLREDAMLALLPQAFPRRSAVMVWIDPKNGWLVTDASSRGKIDDVITALVNSIQDLKIQHLQTRMTPQTGMTQWLAATEPDQWPGEFSVERECELKSGSEDKSVVKFTRHNLNNDEVREHIAQGKLPTRLAMSHGGRIGFVLTESMSLKKIAFLEGVFDGMAKDDASGFDADVALTTGELTILIPALIEALGGELPLSTGEEVEK